MRYKLFLLIIVTGYLLAGINIASIKVTGPNYAENTVNAITEALEANPQIDLILGPSEALGGPSNKSRIHFVYSETDIDFEPADTFSSRMQPYYALDSLCNLAAEYEVTIIPGSLWEVDDDYRLFESIPIIGPDGHIQRVRRKTHTNKRDANIDPTVRLDTIITRDGSSYTYLILISNELHNIANVYPERIGPEANLLLVCSKWIGEDFHQIHDFIHSGCDPDWDGALGHIDAEYYIQNLLDNEWIRPSTPIFLSSRDIEPGAAFTAHLFEELRPTDGWYFFDNYIVDRNYTMARYAHGFPMDGCLRVIIVRATDSDGLPVDSVKVGFSIMPEPCYEYDYTSASGTYDNFICNGSTIHLTFEKESLNIIPPETLLVLPCSSEVSMIDITVMLENIDEEVTLPDTRLIKASPNPFNSSVRLNIGEECDIAIFDIFGHKIFAEEDVKGSIDWQPISISAGIYFLQATHNGSYQTERLVFIP